MQQTTVDIPIRSYVHFCKLEPILSIQKPNLVHFQDGFIWMEWFAAGVIWISSSFICVHADAVYSALLSVNFSWGQIGYHSNHPQPDSHVSCAPLLQCSISETMDSADCTDARRMEMIYTIEDTPPWYLCVFLGLQVLAHIFTHMPSFTYSCVEGCVLNS